MLPFSSQPQRPKYRSSRSVRPPTNNNHGKGLSQSKVIIFAGVIILMGVLMVVPILLLEASGQFQSTNSANHQHPSNMLHISGAIQQQAAGLIPKAKEKMEKLERGVSDALQKKSSDSHSNIVEKKEPEPPQKEVFTELDTADGDKEPASPLVRGVNKLPLSRTPALIGAGRGHIECDVPVDEELIAYWSAPQGDRDQVFETPFQPADAATKTYYLSFQPDRGGWNNIRMSMEILFVMAAATGRTLVLPPKIPLYLLGHGKEGARSFGDFFPLHNPELLKKVKIITMKEFVERESHKWDGLTAEDRERLARVADMCLHKNIEDEDLSCEFLHVQLRKHGFQPQIKPTENCYIFDEDVLKKSATTDTASAVATGLSDESHLDVDRFCGSNRKPVFYDKALQSVEWIHWDAGCDAQGMNDKSCYRLLSHFYTFMYFTDPKIDNYYKRFVRDFLHYNDAVYCAAWKVIKAVQKDADALNVPWSSWHVRRGELQYKKVKIPAEEWWENTKELWRPGELLYIATDERNKKFFDPIKDKHHPVKFLDDYWDIADLGKLDSTYIGMVDTIVASHGRAFAGTWFSTFTGFINRLRGYLGKPMKDSWYSFLPRKDMMHTVTYPEGNYIAREWVLGWLGIDSDERIEFEQGIDEVSLHDKAQLKLPPPPSLEEKKKPDKPILYPVSDS